MNVNLENMIQSYIKKNSEKPDAVVQIGFFEDEGSEPSYDTARVCPFCNESLIDSTRQVKTIIIHCSRWPLATFIRYHAEEMQGLVETKYHEVIVQALEQRALIENKRKLVPDLFRRAFEN